MSNYKINLGGKKVLIVDDSSTMRRIIKNVLKKLNFNPDDFIEAENGKVAWEIWQREGNNIGLILLDWNMPEMNGYDFLKAVRNDEVSKGILGSKGEKVKVKSKNGKIKEMSKFIYDIKKGKGVKIIMVTTEGGKAEVLKAVQAGVNSYIVKPFNEEKIKEKLKELKVLVEKKKD